MTDAEKIKRIEKISAALTEKYPDAVCALEWGGNGLTAEGKAENGWKLLIMGRLSAQCTDARVNIVCRDLFAKYPTCASIANATQEEIENAVKPCGLFRTKAESIRMSCKILCEKYGGRLPDTMEDLLELPGVGRKIANLLLGDVFSKPGVVTDTHFIRICGRFGMYPEDMKDPFTAEKIMTPIIPKSEQSDFCHRIVQFGRDCCTARGPKCGECPLSKLCEHYICGDHK